MDLIKAKQPVRAYAEGCGHAGAILIDLVGRVIRSDAAIERGIDSLRNAAGAREKAVADARELAERWCLQHAPIIESNWRGTQASARKQPARPGKGAHSWRP